MWGRDRSQLGASVWTEQVDACSCSLSRLDGPEETLQLWRSLLDEHNSFMMWTCSLLQIYLHSQLSVSLLDILDPKHTNQEGLVFHVILQMAQIAVRLLPGDTKLLIAGIWILFMILSFTINANKFWLLWVLPVGGTVVSEKYAGLGVGVWGADLYRSSQNCHPQSNFPPSAPSCSLCPNPAYNSPVLSLTLTYT